MTSYLRHTKQLLRKIKPQLVKKYHVDKIGLFGSIVRNDFKPESSDVDVIVSFTKTPGIEFIDMSDLLEKTLQRKTDVISRNGIKEKYFKEIEKDIIYV